MSPFQFLNRSTDFAGGGLGDGNLIYGPSVANWKAPSIRPIHFGLPLFFSVHQSSEVL